MNFDHNVIVEAVHSSISKHPYAIRYLHSIRDEARNGLIGTFLKRFITQHRTNNA